MATPKQRRIQSFSKKHCVVFDNQINLVSLTGTLCTSKSIKFPLLTIAFIYSDKSNPANGHWLFDFENKKYPLVSMFPIFQTLKTIQTIYLLQMIPKIKYQSISTDKKFNT